MSRPHPRQFVFQGQGNAGQRNVPEVEEQLHLVMERLAKRGVSFGINETVPERLAYRYLLEELRQGMDVMPGWVLDGCEGCCEECFQLPDCKSGKKLAEEYHFAVPAPPTPARVLDSENPASPNSMIWRTVLSPLRGKFQRHDSQLYELPKKFWGVT